MTENGIHFVIAAGNFNQFIDSSRAGLHDHVIIVGGIDAEGKRWQRKVSDPDYCIYCFDGSGDCGSNFGPGIDIWAPAAYIRSEPGTGILDPSFNAELSSGTSWAAPMVAGAAALYLETNPGASPEEVKTALISKATLGVLSDLGTGSPNRLLYAGEATVHTPTVLDAPSARFEVTCSDLTCSFDGSDSFARGGKSIVIYEWLFGDGTSVNTTGATVNHTYLASGQYTALLRVYDNENKTGSYLKQLTAEDPLDEPPVAQFGYSCGGSSGTQCTFYGSRSTDDNGIQTWRWDFGDGRVGYGETKQHTYSSTTARPVELRVTDYAGQSHSTTRAVYSGTTFEPPVADFQVMGCEGLTCKVNANLSSDDQGIQFYIWKFGAGGQQVSTHYIKTYTYPAPGNYTVELKVVDGQQGDDVTIMSLDVDSFLGNPPTADFVYNCTGLTCTFNGKSSFDDVLINTYIWNLGDGTSLMGNVRTHTFPSAGTYTVTLTVRDLAGQSDSLSLQVNVSP